MNHPEPTPNSAEPFDAIIVGGGLAGITAALRLTNAGHRVCLLEAAPRLGGRAASFNDPATNETFDTGQHVALGCCDRYAALLKELGTLHLVDWTGTLTWLKEGARPSRLRVNKGPLATAADLLRARFLPLSAKTDLARAFLAACATTRTNWTDRPFSHWLDLQHQSPVARARFWNPLIVSALNAGLDEVAASAGLQVIQDGALQGGQSAAVGVPRVPLSDLIEPARHHLESRGSSVRTAARAQRITETAVTLTSGQTQTARVVIAALPPDRLDAVDPEIAETDPRFAHAASFEFRPIVSADLFFDRSLLDARTPHAVLIERETEWLFQKHDTRKDDNSPPKAHAQTASSHLRAVKSNATDWLGLSDDDIASRVLADIRACLPSAQHATLERAKVFRSRRATFLPAPGTDAIRPRATHPVSKLILAGDWAQTGWPATMEGAVRSGERAAHAALKRLITPNA